MTSDPRYPVGKFTVDYQPTPEKRTVWIQQITDFPGQFRAAVSALPAGALDRPYRDGGWTGRQVVHHVADSHVNAYVRFRLALTEDEPRIKTYEESRWAELIDARTADPSLSLVLLDALHHRWQLLLRSLEPPDFARTATHPESGLINVDYLLQMYSWHGRHHTGHLHLLMS
ncbi:MAG: YfiT family bacillithiol transferase [Vicinamibacterales bacterium]